MTEFTAKDKLLVTRNFFWLTIFAVSLLFIYAQTTWSMVSIWIRSETFAHGFLVLPISIWLVWTRKEHLRIKNLQPAYPVALLLIPPALGWLVAWLVDVSVVQQLALVTMLVVGIWAIVGHRLGRVLAFPLLFLYFAVPMGEGLVAPMMEFTATSTVWLIKLTGIPVYREGMYFSLPTGYWSVVEACSGVRYIIASVTVGTLYAYLTYRSLPRRLLFVVVSMIVPVFANTARAFIIVMLGHWSDMTVATGADHLVYGWVFFGLVIFVLFWLGNFFRESERPPIQYSGSEGVSSVSKSNSILPLTTLGVLAIVSVAPIFAFNGISKQVLTEETVVELPPAIEGWEELSRSPWKWLPPSQVEGREDRYFVSDDGFSIGLSVQYDDGGLLGVDVLGSSTYMAEWRSGSRVALSGVASATILEVPVVVDEAKIAGVDSGLRVWSWYNVGGVSTSNAYIAKLLQAKAHLGFGQLGTYRIVVATSDIDSLDTVRVNLQAFVDQYGTQLYESLQRASVTTP